LNSLFAFSLFAELPSFSQDSMLPYILLPIFLEKDALGNKKIFHQNEKNKKSRNGSNSKFIFIQLCCFLRKYWDFRKQSLPFGRLMRWNNQEI